MSQRDVCQRTRSRSRPPFIFLALLSFVGVPLFLGGASDLGAQVSDADSIPVFDLDSLVVNILRTPVRMGSSPYSVSVAGEAELRRAKNGMFLSDALESLPGVQVQNRFNYAVGERVSIRGFGSRAQFGVRGIHVVVDGIPATLPDGQSTLDHVDIGSLGRVEALRGPASALYGNASGGVLLFETEIPADETAREELTTVGGSDGLLRIQSTTSGTVGGTGYLVSLNRLGFDGYRETPAGDPYGTAERTHLNARLVQEVAGGQLGISFNHVSLDAENPGALPLAAFEDDPHQVWSTYTFFQTRKEVQQSQIGLNWKGDLHGLDAEAAVYGLTRDFLNPLPSDVVDVDRRSGGLRLSLGGSGEPGENLDLHVTGGLEVQVQDDDRREFSSAGGVPETLQQNQTESVFSTGAFLQSMLAVGERVNLVGGIRYDHFDFEVEDLFPVSEGNADDSGERTMDAFSPTVGVSFAVADGIDVFANYATSFETPTTVELGNREDGSGGFNPDLDPQTGRTFEVGARGSLMERVAYEVAVFSTDLEDELVAFENPDGLTYYRNAGASTRTGAEVSLNARIHEYVSGQIAYSYTDAEFEDYTVGGEDLSGNEVPGLSPQQLRASLRTGSGVWYLEFGADYRDEVPVDDANEAPFAEAYTLYDIRVGTRAIELGSVRLTPFLGVQNLTDETYVSSVTINAFGGRYYEPGPSRSFYLGGTLALSR